MRPGRRHRRSRPLPRADTRAADCPRTSDVPQPSPDLTRLRDEAVCCTSFAVLLEGRREAGRLNSAIAATHEKDDPVSITHRCQTRLLRGTWGGGQVPCTDHAVTEGLDRFSSGRAEATEPAITELVKISMPPVLRAGTTSSAQLSGSLSTSRGFPKLSRGAPPKLVKPSMT